MAMGLVLVLVVFVEQQLELVEHHIHHQRLGQQLVSHIHLQLVQQVLHSCLRLQLELHNCLVVLQQFELRLVELLRYRDNRRGLVQ